MRPLKDVFIPKNYMDTLSELKDKYFAWKTEFSSKTDIATTGHITHYEIRDTMARGNFVLVPGLASNTQIEPIMCAVSYWALSHKYNIYTVDTFLGEFKPECTQDLAAKNTLPEFLDLMDAGLDVVSKMSAGQWTCVVAHSLGGTGVLEVANRRVQDNRPIGFSGMILFAPFIIGEWIDFTKGFVKHYQYPDLSDEEFYKMPMKLISPHDVYHSKQVRCVSVYPKFYDDINKLQPRPDLMAKYDIPVTLVAGGLDRKSPPKNIRSVYNAVHEQNANIKFVEFPNSRHSFIDQHNDWNAILRLIKSQHTRVTKK